MPTQPLSELPDRMLSVSQIAKRASVTPQTVYDTIARGDLPAYRFGSRIRVPEAAVLAYLVPVQSADVEPTR